MRRLERLSKTRSDFAELYISGCDRVGDEGAKNIAAITKLQQLHAKATGLSDAGIKSLTTLDNLVLLDLSDNISISDAGMKELSAFKSLTVLGLAGIELSDKCLDDLKKLSKLEMIDLSSTGITANGIAALKKALPSLEIKHDK